MKEALLYYMRNCQQAIIHQDELSFEFGTNFLIVLSFEYKENLDDDDFNDDFFSYNNIDSSTDIDQLIERISQFTAFTIKGYEYLGWREDLTEGNSITNEMFFFVKKINLYRENSILNYATDIDYGDAMCDVSGNYFFAIEIDENLWWDIQFAEYVFNNDLDIVETPNFYTIFFRRNEPVSDSKSLRVLTTNTKTRRLGYFKILSSFLNENKKIPAPFINKKFEQYCQKYNSLLKENLYTKGLISETKTGISAKPYIVTAEDLGLLNKINSLYYSGKTFKVYQILQKQYPKSTNVFTLDNFDKLFFLECVLKNDFFYFKSLLELLYIEENITYAGLVKIFQNHLLYRLSKLKKSNAYGDRKLLNNIDHIFKRIKNWEKPEIYLEHIIMPRLNWMLDFGIITLSKNEYKITGPGSKLFQHLCIWNDINTDEVITPDGFLDRFMVHLYEECFIDDKTNNPKSFETILEKVYKHIEESFIFFKTLAPNRVTASQAANYTKYKLYLEDCIKVGYQFILNELAKKEQNKFIFKYQEQYQDGYIQKLN